MLSNLYHNYNRTPTNSLAQQQSEENIALYKWSPIPTYVWKNVDNDFILIDYNDAALTITDNKIADLIGMRASEFYWDNQEIQNEFARCLEQKTPIDREMLYKFKTTGKEKYLSVKYVYVPPDLILVHTEDITARKRAEESLRESERRYRTLVETLQEGVGIVDSNENIIFANSAYSKMFGYSREKIIGMNLSELMPPDEFQKVLQESAKRKKGMISQYDLIMKQKEGQLINVRVTASPWMSEQKEFKGTIGVVLDMTEQIQREKALKENEKKYRELANLLPQTVFEIDAEANFRFINHHGFETFGYSIQDIKDGLNILQLFIAQDRDRMNNDIRKVLCGDKLNGNEYTALTKNGKTFPISIYSSPIISEGKALGLRGFAIDISERVKARVERKRLSKQLAEAEKMVTLGQFTAALTHEINNPLDIIQNKLFLLQTSILKNYQNPELLDHINKIIKQVTRISNLSEDVLNYVKPRLITLKSVDINRIILNVIESLSDYFNETLLLTTDLTPNLPKIQGDALGLEIVFNNILLNAVESLPQNGRIRVVTKSKNRLLEINVTDNGIGIPAKDIQKVFDPFFSRKIKSRGTGLGLTICKKIIDEHKGKIHIKSRPNVGTSVIVQFEIVGSKAQGV